MKNLPIDTLKDPNFILVAIKCLRNKEFLAEFERLSDIKLPNLPKNPLDTLIDINTGYFDTEANKFLDAFLPFVHEYVYLPLLSEYEKNGKAN